MRGGKVEFGEVGNRPYQVVLRLGEVRRGSGRPHMHDE